jgi:hypothetical protein
MMIGRDTITGLVCLAVSIGLLLLTRGIPPAIMVPIGPAFYPRVVLVLLAILSVVLIVLELRTAHTQPASASAKLATAEDRPAYGLVLLTTLAFALYIALLPELGFRISTFLFVAGLQAVLDRPRTLQRWALLLLVAAATSLICFILFEDYLSVFLPRGRWSGL